MQPQFLVVGLLVACGSVKADPDAPLPDDQVPIDDMTIDGPPSLAKQRIVYAANVAGIDQIWSMRLDGTDKKQITNEAAQSIFAAVRPDGKKIIFDTANDLFEINFDGTGRRQITTNAASDFRPAYSRDGQRIAFASGRDGGTNVYVMSAATGDAGTVTRLSMGANVATFPTMGGTNKVAFTDNTTMEVMLINEDGSGLTNLTNNAAGDSTPSFSLDGTKIAFSSDRLNGSQIWMMNADGSNPTQITTDATTLKFFPSFDLTAEHVTYFAGSPRNIFRANVDGTGTPAQLTTDADKVTEKLACWTILEE